MKWFQKSKNWMAILICALFLAGCGAAQLQSSDISAESLPESAVSAESAAEDGESSQLEAEESSKFAASDHEEEQNEASSDLQSEAEASSKASDASSVSASSRAVTSNASSSSGSGASVSSKAAVSSKPAAASKAPVSSAAPVSSNPPASSTAPASSSAAPSSQTPVSSQTSSAQQGTSVDAYARQVVELVNAERAKEGLAPLTVDEQMMSNALIRSKELVTSFSHQRPNGEQGYEMVMDAGYYGAGENIAYGYTTAESVMEGWMNSQGHRENILRESFTHIGVGCYRDSSGRLYWTQLFGMK